MWREARVGTRNVPDRVPGGTHPGNGGPGVLTLAGAPIGQAEDAPARLAEALASADVIAAEDTRRVRQLATALDVRLARYQHKCMEYGHHNHCYNFQEHHLVRRAEAEDAFGMVAQALRARDDSDLAEEVAEVYPDLVAHSADGKIETVKYQLLDSMLLNEVQRQQEQIRRLEERLAQLESALTSISGASRANVQ